MVTRTNCDTPEERHDLADRLSVVHQHSSPSGKIGLCICPQCPDLRTAGAVIRRLDERVAELEDAIRVHRSAGIENCGNDTCQKGCGFDRRLYAHLDD